jgi:hypothetical protein
VIYKYLDPDLEESQLLAAENEYGLYGYLNLKNEVIIAFQYEHYPQDFGMGLHTSAGLQKKTTEE